MLLLPLRAALPSGRRCWHGEVHGLLASVEMLPKSLPVL